MSCPCLTELSGISSDSKVTGLTNLLTTTAVLTLLACPSLGVALFYLEALRAVAEEAARNEAGTLGPQALADCEFCRTCGRIDRATRADSSSGRDSGEKHRRGDSNADALSRYKPRRTDKPATVGCCPTTVSTVYWQRQRSYAYRRSRWYTRHRFVRTR